MGSTLPGDQIEKVTPTLFFPSFIIVKIIFLLQHVAYTNLNYIRDENWKGKVNEREEQQIKLYKERKTAQKAQK